MLINYKDSIFCKCMETAFGRQSALLQMEADRVESIIFKDHGEVTMNYRDSMNILTTCNLCGVPKTLFDLGVFKNLKSLGFYRDYRFLGKHYLHKVSPTLESLVLVQASEADLAELGRFPNLKYLRLSGEGSLASIPREVRKNLRTLFISDMRGIESLSDCHELTELGISMTSPCVSQWPEELRLEKLKRLTLHCMTLRFGKENPFPELQYLNAKGLPGTWIKNLEKLKKLQDVNLSQCEIYDVSMLKGLPLKVLEIQDNMIEDITPICQNESLEYLSLSGNPVEDIAPMGGLKNLQVLHLDDTWVEDISPLMKLDRLEEVILPRSIPRYEEQLEQFKRKFKNIVVI